MYRDASEEVIGMRVQQLAREIDVVDKAIHDGVVGIGKTMATPPAVLALYARREELTRELLALYERSKRP